MVHADDGAAGGAPSRGALEPYEHLLAEGETRHGRLTWFRHDDPVGLALGTYGEWAWNELSLLTDLLRVGDTVLDVGSYIGTHAATFARAVGAAGSVRAFEPQPVVVEVLRRNVSGLTQVQVHHAAVGEAPGSTTVAAPAVEEHGNFGASTLLLPSSGAGIEVPVLTVDSLELDSLRLLKVDVEGMEEQVLRGAARTLHEQRPVVYAECNTLVAGAPVLPLLQGAGYRVWLHRPPAYDSDNFAGDPDNRFGVACESNLLALPPDVVREVVEQVERRSDTVFLTDLDSLAVELLRTPRYGDHAVGDRDPADVLRRLQDLDRRHDEMTRAWHERLETQDVELAAARQQLRESERSAAAIESQARDLTFELRTERSRSEKVRVQLDEVRHELARNAAELLEERERLRQVMASTSWRVSAPLRRLGPLRRSVAGSASGRALRSVALLAAGRLPEDLRRRRQVEALRSARVLDPEWYAAQYPDVPASRALQHYVDHGGVEGRRANPVFDADWYLDQYPDVAASGVLPLVHYVVAGAAEGRDPGPAFSTSFYVASNDDVREAGVNPLGHYLQHGRDEGRPARPPEQELEEPAAARPVAPTAEEWSVVTAPPGGAEPSVVVVVPAYRGLDETLRCLYSVLTSPVRVPYRVVVVDDCSPEPELSAGLRSLAERGLFELVVNPTNQGFVKSANSGAERAGGADVVLLNSDTEVYGDWLDRLHRAAWNGARIGTLTPLTNSGTIASYPRFARDNSAELELPFNELDALAALVLRGEVVDVPTGVGFCLYLRRDCLEDVGLLDEEAFGLGYGEENDLCRRAAARGWRNVLVGEVFVRHYGSTSFKEASVPLQRQGLKVLNRRYPGYDQLIAAHIAADPAGRLRRELDLARLQQARGGRPSMVLLTHALGGGTTKHVEELADRLWAEGVFPLLLRPGPDGRDVRLGSPLAAATPNLTAPWSADEGDELVADLRTLGVVHVHVHHLQGLLDAPRTAALLAARLGVELDVTLHDYAFVCPRVDMVDDSRRFCGGPELRKCRACIDRNGSPSGRPEVRAWQADHEALLRAARMVYAPSRDTAQRFERLVDGLEVTVRPHPELPGPDPLPVSEPPAGRTTNVAVLGAVGVSKGSDVLLSLAEDAQRRGLALRFTVFGHTDADARFRHLPGVRMTGRYEQARLPELVRRSGCAVALFPAVWPETFSFTLSEALDLGLHPVAFDIGALAGRLREAGAGTVLPWEWVDEPALVNDRLMEVQAGRIPAPRPRADYRDLLRDYYGVDPVRWSASNSTE